MTHICTLDKLAEHKYGRFQYCSGCGRWGVIHWLRAGMPRTASTFQRVWIPIALWLFALVFWFAHVDERVKRREPDLIIGPASDPQTKRWHLWRWRGWQLALHEWCRSDHDRALHDHLGDNWTLILDGWYDEVFSHRWEGMRMALRRPWVPYYRRAEEPHRVVIEPRVLHRGRCVTLWLRMPPRREWGFVCPKGWRHNSEYIAERNYYDAKASTVGKGCD